MNSTAPASFSPLPRSARSPSHRWRCLVKLSLVVLAMLPALPSLGADLFRQENLNAWCLVPFDAKKRGPEERAAMLERIGIRKFVYDYRAEHVPTFDEEMLALKRHGIELTGWWFPGSMSADAQLIIDVLKRHQMTKCDLWVTGNGGAMQKTPEEQAKQIAAEVTRLKPIATAAASLGVRVLLYNHGSWYGEPENLVAITQAMHAAGAKNVGIVYNLHHGHGHLDRLDKALALMLPYLGCLNLNGMDVAGDTKGRKILPLGVGTEDVRVLQIIKASGYTGPIGILNHTPEDAEARLLDNVDGLRWLLPQLDGGKAPGPRPAYRSWSDKPQAATPARSAAARPASGVASLSPAFGKALSGGLLVDGKDDYRTRPFTIECRAKLTAKTRYNILVACDPKSSAAHWEFYTHAGSGELALYQPGRGGDYRAKVDVCDGQWHDLAAQVDETRVQLFVDAKLVLDVPAKPQQGEVKPAGLAIGRLVEGGIGCDGVIDDVRLSRGLIAIEASAKPRIKTASTLGLWSFDELPEAAPAAAPPVAKPQASREHLPLYKTIPAANPDSLTPTNGWPSEAETQLWQRSLGGSTSNRFSSLKQITKANVAKLVPAWTHHSRDGEGNVQCNPIIVGRTLFAPTAGKAIVAIDAASGAECWHFKPEIEGKRLEDTPARRGLLYWPGSEGHAPRLIFGCGYTLWAISPEDGKPIATFGKQGRAPMPGGTTAVGAVHGTMLVMAGYNGDVFGFDVRDGAQRWRFHTKPQAGEFGADTWSQIEDGANCWGGMALDTSRGIAYVSTGSPKPNFFGAGHLGDNLFSNCVLALDAQSGKRLWHFQEVRHDIWDWDIPAPPNLVTVERHGRKVDAVAQVTKQGNTLLLDRLSGQPLYDFRLQRADTHGLPGDITAEYQPALELPQPFARQAYTAADMPEQPEARALVEPLVKRANLGRYPSLDEAKPTLLFNIHGGAEWTGAAADDRGRLYVTSNEVPWFMTFFRNDDPPPAKPATEGEKVYMSICFACHGPDRRGIGHAPPLLGLRHRLEEKAIRDLIKTGRGIMPPMPQLTEAQVKPLIDFLLCRDRPIVPRDPSEPPQWTFGGWNRLVDAAGYPGCKPPWGTLNCIDLNTGKLAWQVPFGEYPELKAKGVPKTGQENFGGAMVTASGLVFASGTRDKKLRAFDADTGKELWSHQLPVYGTAPPASYAIDGRQYLVLPVTGGGKLGQEKSDAIMAFALPE